MGQIGIVIVGTGSIAFSSHIPAILSIPEAKLVGVCDTRKDLAKRIAYKFGTETLTFEEALKRKDVHEIVLCTSTNSHYELVLKALKAGKHVFCEKPLSVTSKQAKEMVDAAKKSNKKTMLGFDERFNPYNLKIKEIIDSKILGEPISFDFQFILPPKLGWRVDPKLSGGGPMWDSGPHKIDILRTLFGDPVKQTGELKSRFLKTVEDYAKINFTFKKNIKGSLLVALDQSEAKILKENFKIIFTEGELEKNTHSIRMDETIKLTVKKNNSIFKEPLELDFSGYERVNMFKELHKNFIDAILNNKEPAISFDDGYKNLLILDKLKKYND